MNLKQCIRGGSEDMRNGFVLAFHYDLDTVELLKRSVPHTDREWREDSKTWWVSSNYEGALKRIFSNFEALVYWQGSLF